MQQLLVPGLAWSGGPLPLGVQSTRTTYCRRMYLPETAAVAGACSFVPLSHVYCHAASCKVWPKAQARQALRLRYIRESSLVRTPLRRSVIERQQRKVEKKKSSSLFVAFSSLRRCLSPF